MTRSSRLAATVVLAAVGATVAGCGARDSTAPHPTPTAAADCNDLATHDGDGFVLAGSDWSGNTHAYAETATVYACVSASTGGTVGFRVTGAGITVSPARRPVSAYPSGVVPFRVRVSPGGSGSLTMTHQGPSGGSGGPGPEVVATADGWHFASAG